MSEEVLGRVASRLQAALWREVIHLVIENVASVEYVVKSVYSGASLRGTVIGAHMLFSHGSGGHGLDFFFERFGPYVHRWWGVPD